MAAPKELYYFTGRQEVSGTGRSQRRTNIVNPCSNYDSVPTLGRVTAKNGTSVRLTKDAGAFKAYWEEFSKYSAYQAEFEAKSAIPILTAGNSDRTVGAIAKSASGGALLFVPILNIDTFTKTKDGKEYWTAEGTKFGHRLSASLSSLAEAIEKKSQLTPPPMWTSLIEYRLARESILMGEIREIATKIEELSSEKSEREKRLVDAGILRHLLYEQGRPLEAAVLEAMKIFGFSAENVSNGDSEFDVVFVSEEGRCLGEVEGKETKAINIEKFSQLERNIQEDFAKEYVSEYAKAVLFGNAHRLKPLNERADFFTEKCQSAARRVGAALVRTPDLFGPAKYLQETQDVGYAKACRQAIVSAVGAIVIFPAVPNSQHE